LGLGKLARSDALPLRVVTFNVDGGAQVVPQLDALLADWRPDLFAAQECGDELAAALRARTGWTFDQVGGLCLLSRYPVVSRSVMDRRVLSAIRNGGAQIGGSGAVVRYAIRTPMGLVHFTNVHLETPRWGLQDLVQGRHLDPTRLELNTQLRDVESDLARRYVDAGGGHAIVAGDFNTPSESRIFRRHWGDLTDAFTAAGVGLGMTKYNGWIRVRIDHVLADPSLRIVGARVGQDAGSDHLPLIVDIEQ
jgi:endonuclease/exonuclease/phosphatase (EEP) superfamily protein YafD